jgi:hypothetical protein
METDRLVPSRPLHLRADDLEAGVERAVRSDWLPELGRVLGRRGVEVSVDDLGSLPFAVERSLEVEYALAGKEVDRAEAG